MNINSAETIKMCDNTADDESIIKEEPVEYEAYEECWLPKDDSLAENSGEEFDEMEDTKCSIEIDNTAFIEHNSNSEHINEDIKLSRDCIDQFSNEYICERVTQCNGKIFENFDTTIIPNSKEIVVKFEDDKRSILEDNSLDMDDTKSNVHPLIDGEKSERSMDKFKKINETEENCLFAQQGNDNNRENAENESQIDGKRKRSSSQNGDGKKIHKCSFCGFATLHEAHLTKHTEVVHLKVLEYKCEICDFAAAQKIDIKTHFDAVHLKMRTYKCEFCNYSANHQGDIKIHTEAVHFKLKTYKCKSCDYSTAKREHIKAHAEAVHFKLKKFKCESCDYATARKRDIKKHVEAVHLKLKKFKCEFCDHTAFTEQNIRIHTAAVHLNLKTYECEFCDYATSHQGNIKKHTEAVHLNNRKYRCDSCDYSTARKENLKAHFGGVHFKLQKFKCGSCNYTTMEMRDVQRHIKTVHLKFNKCE